MVCIWGWEENMTEELEQEERQAERATDAEAQKGRENW